MEKQARHLKRQKHGGKSKERKRSKTQDGRQKKGGTDGVEGGGGEWGFELQGHPFGVVVGAAGLGDATINLRKRNGKGRQEKVKKNAGGKRKKGPMGKSKQHDLGVKKWCKSRTEGTGKREKANEGGAIWGARQSLGRRKKEKKEGSCNCLGWAKEIKESANRKPRRRKRRE